MAFPSWTISPFQPPPFWQRVCYNYHRFQPKERMCSFRLLEQDGDHHRHPTLVASEPHAQLILSSVAAAIHGKLVTPCDHAGAELAEAVEPLGHDHRPWACLHGGQETCSAVLVLGAKLLGGVVGCPGMPLCMRSTSCGGGEFKEQCQVSPTLLTTCCP